MRKAIYEYLGKGCKSIERWLQPYQPAGNTPKPYGVIVIGEKNSDAFNRLGLYRNLYIWPYLSTNSYILLDEAVGEITDLLSDAVLSTNSGEVFNVEWVGEGRDFYDIDLKAITRRLDFRVPLIL